MLVAELFSRQTQKCRRSRRRSAWKCSTRCRRSSNMKKHALLFSASLLASALIVPISSSLVFAQAASDKAAPDNSAQNQRDRDHQTLTPIDQSNKPADLETTRNIRQALVKDDRLSTEAKNVKIITVDGAVTLRGPVKTPQ